MTVPENLVLDLQQVSVHFKRWDPERKEHQSLKAVDRVNLEIQQGEIFGLVGESGSGKSTLAQVTMMLQTPTAGNLLVRGTDPRTLSRRAIRGLRRSIQMVFQDPYSSLDPSMTIGESLTEPLRVHKLASGPECHSSAVEAIERVGLSADNLSRYPNEFSGGQRQRIAIARALILSPELVVLDEAVSALDVSTRGQILQLLESLQEENRCSYLFIAHDLSVVRRISTKVGVMYLGQIVETGTTDRVISSPAHPYTAALIASVPNPRPVPSVARDRYVVHVDPPNPWDPPSGCKFHTRCPFAMAICKEKEPAPYALDDGGFAACHLHEHGPKLAGRSVLDLADDVSVFG